MRRLLALISIYLIACPAYAAAPSGTASLLGVYNTDNVPALTFGYQDQFGNTNGGSIIFRGSTSGTTTIKPNATAGTSVLTLPTETADTLVDLTGTQTLTNKTLTAPTINGVVGGTATSQTITTLTATTVVGAAFTGPAPTACGATCSITTANAGTGLILLNQAGGSTVTLPGATGTGNVYKMLITVATTSAAEKVLTNPTTDAIIGTAIGENGGTAKIFVGNASTYHSIQMPYSGSQPSGGFIGDNIVCTDVASATWACNIQYQAGTTPTTPYSASTS